MSKGSSLGEIAFVGIFAFIIVGALIVGAITLGIWSLNVLGLSVSYNTESYLAVFVLSILFGGFKK